MRRGELSSMTSSQTTSTIQGKTVVLFLAGAAMIGQGLRMIYQGLFQPHAVYRPGPVDLCFDWSTLVILGAAVLYFAVTASLNVRGRHNEQTVRP